MSRPEIGDLAYVLKGHCFCGHEGRVVRVLEISAPFPAWCAICGTALGAHQAAFCDNQNKYALAFLRRIPPLSELDQLSDKHDIPVTKELA